MGLIVLVLSALLILFVVQDNRRRHRRRPAIALRPNCLITGSPLLFVSGKRSLFYFLSFWGDLPHFLAQHGYEVFHLNLPWKSEATRLKTLSSFLHEQIQKDRKFHLVIESSSRTIVEKLFLAEHMESVSSCMEISSMDVRTALGKCPLLRPLQQPIDQIVLPVKGRSPLWRLHEWRTQQTPTLDLRQQLNLHRGTRRNFDIILDQVILIAEKDFSSQETTTGEAPHDSSANRPSGNILFPAEFS